MGLQRVRHDWACTQHTYSIAKGVIVTQKWDRVGKPWCLWIQLHSTLTCENSMQILACGKAFEFIFLCSMSFHNFSCLNMCFKWTVCGLWTWGYLSWHHLKPEVPVSLKYWFAMFYGIQECLLLRWVISLCFFQPCWDIIDMKHCVSLRYSVWRFGTNIYCKMITTRGLANTSITSCNFLFVRVVRMLKICFPSNLQVYHVVLISVVTMLYISSPELVYLIWNFVSFKQHLSTSPIPIPWQLPFYFLFLWGWLFQISHKSEITRHLSFLCITYFTV